MVALLAILFFGFTGLTLNHPTWTLGDSADSVKSEGTLSFSPVNSDSTVNFLEIAEFARDELGASGSIDNYEVNGTYGSISFKKAGYTGEIFFDTRTKAYKWSAEQLGWAAVFNDLHKGRHTGSTWSWIIDISAILLVVVAITGLAMQFLLKRRRRSALTLAGIGSASLIALLLYTMR